MRVNHFIPFKVLLGDQVCGRRVHQWQRGLRPWRDQDGWPQQGGHPPSNHGPRPQVSGGKSLRVFTKNVSGTFLQNLIFSDRRQYFYPKVISSFLKLLNERKSFNYYSYKTETKIFCFLVQQLPKFAWYFVVSGINLNLIIHFLGSFIVMQGKGGNKLQNLAQTILQYLKKVFTGW